VSSACSRFHSCCDSAGPTLILVQDSRGNAFGAYASRGWSSPAKAVYQRAAGSFLFSLVRMTDKPAAFKPPTKFDLEKPDCSYTMFCAASCGPVLGFGFLPLSPSASRFNCCCDLQGQI
jgi:hypothetical protein